MSLREVTLKPAWGLCSLGRAELRLTCVDLTWRPAVCHALTSSSVGPGRTPLRSSWCQFLKLVVLQWWPWQAPFIADRTSPQLPSDIELLAVLTEHIQRSQRPLSRPCFTR